MLSSVTIGTGTAVVSRSWNVIASSSILTRALVTLTHLWLWNKKNRHCIGDLKFWFFISSYYQHLLDNNTARWRRFAAALIQQPTWDRDGLATQDVFEDATSRYASGDTICIVLCGCIDDRLISRDVLSTGIITSKRAEGTCRSIGAAATSIAPMQIECRIMWMSQRRRSHEPILDCHCNRWKWSGMLGIG